jgi:alpha-L-fucosidase
MKRLLVFLAVLPCLAQTYKPEWSSIDKRPTPPWFQDAKFGIFIHWGVYSVPSFAPVKAPKQTPYAEWYWNSLEAGRKKQADGGGSATWAFHVRNYGADFPYQNFAPMFRAELFNPDSWADIFQRSGAKYIVLTSKHHEGFPLWPNEQANRTWGRPWNAGDIGPKRDLLGGLTDAVRRKGLKMGIYYSLYEWYNPLWLTDRARYVTEHMHPQFKDVVTRYKPSIIFSDGEWDMTSAEWKSPELLAWLFNDSPARDDVVINDRWGKETRHKHGGYFTTEYTAGMENTDHPWEESRGMGFSYGYNRMEGVDDYRTGRELVLMLVDLVSRGGNLLLDIGPTADGRIPVIMQDRLLHMGRWLGTNGEAIYGTQSWRKTRQWSAGKVPEVKTNQEFMTHYEVYDLVERKSPDQAVIEAFFTTKDGNLYAILPGWPGKELVLHDVAPADGANVALVGTDAALAWRRDGEGIRVTMPDFPPRPSDAYVVRVTGVK